MNYGLYLSASGLLTSMYRQDVVANNLANVNTPAFKPEVSVTRQRDAARVEDGLFSMPSNAMLERLGAGALLAPNRFDPTPGPFQETGEELDVAINGTGYFVAANGQGSDSERYRFTRDGRLTVDSSGRLVQVATGLPVLDVGDRAIQVGDRAGLSIDSGGYVMRDGRQVARLQVVNVAQPDTLTRAGDGLLKASANAIRNRAPADVPLLPRHIETSAVDPVAAMMEITDTGNAVAMNGRMIQLHDELMNRAINSLGRVA